MKHVPHSQRVVLVLATALGACSSPDSDRPPISVRDSSGVEIVELSAASLTASPSWSIGDVPTVILGADEEGQQGQFFRISGVWMVPGSRIAVATDASKQVVLFDSTGVPLTSFGRHGRGPGEFLHLRQLTSGDSSHLALYDALHGRITVIDNGLVGAPKVVGIAGNPGGRATPLYLFSDGTLLVRRAGPRPTPTESGVVRTFDTVAVLASDGSVIAAMGTHPADDRVLRRRASGSLTGGEPPFGRRLLIAAIDTSVYITAGGTSEVRQYSTQDGHLARLVRLQVSRRPVTGAIRRAYRQRVLDGVTDAYGVDEWTRLSSDDVFPRELPAFDSMLSSVDGSLWLRESVIHGEDRASWIVVSSSGRPLSRLTLPTPFTPYHILHDRVAGTWLDSAGGEQVRVYRISR